MLILRGLPSSEVWNTEENGARKGHVEQEQKPSLSVLITYTTVVLHRFLRLVLLLLLYHSGKLSSLILICSFFSIFCTSSSSSGFIAKAIWVSLEIAALSYGGLDMEITGYHSWRELIYHFLERICCDLFLTCFCPSAWNSCPLGAATMRLQLRHYWWQVNTFQYIGLWHWPRRCCAL